MNKTNILIECQELLASVRVGVIEPLRSMIEDGKVEIRFKRTLDIKKEDIVWCDVLITVRAVEEIALKTIKEANKLGRYIIYFLDDDFLGLPPDLPGCEIFGDEKIKKNIVEILKITNILWCVNPLIGEKYGIYTQKGYVLSKVPVNFKIKQIEEKKEKIKILYAGSESHSPMVSKYLKPLAIKLSEEFKNKIEITFIGANPKIDLSKLKNIKFVKTFENYDEYKIFVEKEKFDIGLAVVGEEEFYKYKYYNKFIEYTSIGCVGVYSNLEPYRLVVENFQNGILTENTEEDWYNNVKLLIEDNNLRNQCLITASELLLEDFGYAKISNDLEKDIPEIINYRARKIKESEVKLPNLKIVFMKERLIYLIKKYKFMFFFVIIQKIIKKIVKFIFEQGRKIGCY